MPVVQRLPEALANQIAAGEVVERPAAAVKELVENALDAGATRIEILLEDGGRRGLEVVDDGKGMARDDALLALERHTTSKLRTSDDLFDIRTFGFRGEALPSIASVSRLRLTTREPSALAATRIESEGGKILSVEDAGAPAGTRVEVRDLFFNVPARLKFLKARATELGHVTDWVSRLALANPAVTFVLSEDGRNHLRADGTAELKERIAQVLGRDLFGALYPVEARSGDVSLSGFCAGPQRQNATTREIYTFVNGRFVRDRGLLHAVSRAYEGVLQVGRSPAVVLFLDVPPGKVDVNVHPQKLEVRFSEPRAVYDAVAKSVAHVLSASPWLQSSAPRRTYTLQPSNPVPVATPSPVVLPVPLAPPPRQLGLPERPVLDPSWAPREERLQRTFVRVAEPEVQEELPIARDSVPPPPFPGDEPLRFSELRYLGQVHRTYLACESPRGLVLLDQHAAHERVLYEKFRAERAGEATRGQPLLVPLTMEFSPSDARLVESALEELTDLGFELEPFGGTTFSLHAAPRALSGSDLARSVRELAHELRQFESSRAADALEESLLARMACHAAVRKGHPLEPPEAIALLQQLDGTPFHAQCPHGRPVAVRFENGALEEMFKRTYEGTPRAALRDRLERS